MKRAASQFIHGGLLLAVSVALLLMAGPALADSSDCDQKQPQEYAGAKVAVTVPEGAAFAHEINRQRSGEVSEELKFGMSKGVQLPAKGASLSGEPVGSFPAVKGEGHGRIRSNNIRVGVTASGGNKLIVNVCIAPKDLEPGRYAGTILVKGAEIEQFEIKVTATVQASKWLLWLLIAVAAGAFGFALRTLANVAQLAERPPTPTGRRRRDIPLRTVWPLYRRDRLIFIGSILLATIAVGVAWYGAYWTNETFGAHDLADWGKLALAALVAATGGITLADLAGALKYKPSPA